ncbi:hypothetical protein MLD38_001983 [Melastoma candidum]|uniref:Uncharacterized protein n=1 Tax=Melastoma candidum TaxID=119954 RepID=A0ACB9SF27_9MYRT|nr:hypothetical protein MLD38_001983 [Melastoma candidum]
MSGSNRRRSADPIRHHPLDTPNGSSTSSSSFLGGLFVEPTLPSSFARLITPPLDGLGDSGFGRIRLRKGKEVFRGCGFLSVSFKGDQEKRGLGLSGDAVKGGKKEGVVAVRRGGGVAMNTTKHLWAGAISAMVSRTFVAPLERLKLEYIVRGEQRNIFDLIKMIAISQGLRGFWKGNIVNIIRTAPFKAINFCAYDTYRKQFLRLSGNDETTNSERFIAGAAAGITATILCLPLDTIRTKLVAQGGEVLGGVVGAFRHMIQTEAYLHSPEGRKRIQNLSEQGQELNALDQLELGPMRTLLYGAISGACAEAATYPFEVVRRQLQLQDRAKRLSSLATLAKIVEQGGVPALYAGLIPSLLQVLPSAAISYFIYEFMKVVLSVD